MRVNIYTEELTPEVTIVQKTYMSRRSNMNMTNYGVRIFFKSHPALHHNLVDDDRSAITFWCGNDPGACFAFLKQVLINTENKLAHLRMADVMGDDSEAKTQSEK